MTPEALQDAIDMACKSSLAAVSSKAFNFHLTPRTWQPKPKCLTEYYSSGERVVCGILLAAYFALHGAPANLEIPEPRTWEHSPADLVWPGGHYFVSAANLLSEKECWTAIRLILPGAAPTSNPGNSEE